MVWTPRRATTTRDLTASLGSDWTGGTVTARRPGDVVMIDMQQIARAAPGTGETMLLTLPVGFRPSANIYGASFRGMRTRCRTTGAMSIYDPSASFDYLSFTYITSDGRTA